MKDPLEFYRGKLRIRACGLCFLDSGLILVKHEGVGTNGIFWAPPGGGVEPGESIVDALKREFLEEVSLDVKVGPFLFIHEFINNDLHAIELFFHVKRESGNVRTGFDPEHSRQDQLIAEARPFSEREIKTLPPEQRHQIFNYACEFSRLLKLKGYFKSENNSIK